MYLYIQLVLSTSVIYVIAIYMHIANAYNMHVAILS